MGDTCLMNFLVHWSLWLFLTELAFSEWNELVRKPCEEARQAAFSTLQLNQAKEHEMVAQWRNQEFIANCSNQRFLDACFAQRLRVCSLSFFHHSCRHFIDSWASPFCLRFSEKMQKSYEVSKTWISGKGASEHHGQTVDMWTLPWGCTTWSTKGFRFQIARKTDEWARWMSHHEKWTPPRWQRGSENPTPTAAVLMFLNCECYNHPGFMCGSLLSLPLLTLKRSFFVDKNIANLESDCANSSYDDIRSESTQN